MPNNAVVVENATYHNITELGELCKKMVDVYHVLHNMRWLYKTNNTGVNPENIIKSKRNLLRSLIESAQSSMERALEIQDVYGYDDDVSDSDFVTKLENAINETENVIDLCLKAVAIAHGNNSKSFSDLLNVLMNLSDDFFKVRRFVMNM
jgi:hypothetical protein